MSSGGQTENGLAKMSVEERESFESRVKMRADRLWNKMKDFHSRPLTEIIGSVYIYNLLLIDTLREHRNIRHFVNKASEILSTAQKSSDNKFANLIKG